MSSPLPLLSVPPQPKGEFAGDKQWRLDERIEYGVTGGSVVLLPGFLSDGASIPQFLWSFGVHPFNGQAFRAALLHDGLYAAELFDRKTCDELFRQALVMCGFSRWKAWTFYEAVRSFGWAVWKRHTQESIVDARGFVKLVDVAV